MNKMLFTPGVQPMHSDLTHQECSVTQPQPDDYRYHHRSSISMTTAMWQRLQQVVAARRDPKFKTSDAVREAIRFYLDHQADLIGSRKHFGRSLQRSLTAHEQSMLFSLHALMLLVARLFAYLIKVRDGKEIEPLKLIESAIVDSKLLSTHLLDATDAIRRDKSLKVED